MASCGLICIFLMVIDFEHVSLGHFVYLLWTNVYPTPLSILSWIVLFVEL